MNCKRSFFLSCVFLFFIVCGVRAQSLGGIPDLTFNPKDIGYSGYADFHYGNQILYQGRLDEVLICIPSGRKGPVSRFFTRDNWYLYQANPDGSSVADWQDSTRRLIQYGSTSLVIRDHTNQLFTVFSYTKDSASVYRQDGKWYSQSQIPDKFRVPNHTFGIQKAGIEKRSPNRYFFWVTFSDDSTRYNHRTMLVQLDSLMKRVGQPHILDNFYCHKSSQGPDGKLYLIGQKAIPNLDWAHPGTTYFGTRIIEFAPNLLETNNPFPGLDTNLIQGPVQVFEVMNDGRFLIAGKLSHNFAAPEICLRLQSDGQLDNSFTPALVQPGTGVCWSKRKGEPVRVGWVRKTASIHKAYQGLVGENGGLTTSQTMDLDRNWPVGKALFYHYYRQMFLYETGDFTPWVGQPGYGNDTIAGMRFRYYMGTDQSLIPMLDNYGVFSHGFGPVEAKPQSRQMFLQGNVFQVNGRPYPGGAVVNEDGSVDTTFKGVQVFPEPWKSWGVLTRGNSMRYIGGKFLMRRWNIGSWGSNAFPSADTVYRYNKDGTLDDDFLPFRSSTDFKPYKNKGYITAFANTSMGQPAWVDAAIPSGGAKLFISILDSNANLTKIVGPIQVPAGYDSAVVSNRSSYFIGHDSKGCIWRAYHQSSTNSGGPSWSKRYFSITNPETGQTRFLQMDSSLMPGGHEIRVTPAGNYIFLGNNSYGNGQNPKVPYLVQVDSNGHFVSNADLAQPLYLNKPDGFAERNVSLRIKRVLPDGKLLVLMDGAQTRLLTRYLPDGRYDPSFLPIRNYTDYYNIEIPVIGDRIFCGGYISPYSYEIIEQYGFTTPLGVVGSSRKTGLHAFLLNSAPNNVSYIQGKIEQVPSPFDGCNPAVARKPVAGRLLNLEPGSRVAFTDNNGQFTLVAPPGTYTLSQHVGNNALQRQICPAPPQLEREVSLASANTVAFGQNFINQTYTCPRLGMSMSTPRFRLCSKGQIQINYYNDGMNAEPNARVHLFLPEVVKVTSASRPFTKLADSSLVFDIGNLEPNQRGILVIQDTVGCPHTPDSMARACFSARMEPLNLCNEVVPSQINWDGAWLDGYARYDQALEQVKLVVKNRGSQMADSIPINIGHTGQAPEVRKIKLAAGDSLVRTYPASATGNLGMWLTQPINCPLGSTSQLFHAGTNTATSYMSFSNGWFELQTAAACPPFRYSYDPNEKLVYPEGDIQPGTELNYTINFENFGNDTAYAVSVVDSLPPGLVFKSLHLKGSSHPCSMMMAGDSTNPIITFNFRDLKLTPKRQDSILSKGHCSFTIKTDLGTTAGFEWHNRAHIYFDGNPAVTTNTVVNRVSAGTTESKPVEISRKLLSVFPNPSAGLFQVQFSQNTEKQSFTLTDVQGRSLKTGNVVNQSLLDLRHLPPGIYVLKVNGYRPQRLMVQP